MRSKKHIEKISDSAHCAHLVTQFHVTETKKLWVPAFFFYRLVNEVAPEQRRESAKIKRLSNRDILWFVNTQIKKRHAFFFFKKKGYVFVYVTLKINKLLASLFRVALECTPLSDTDKQSFFFFIKWNLLCMKRGKEKSVII